jgi:hypothetical protein
MTATQNAPKTESELDAMVADGTLKISHTASCRGYLSRKGGSKVEPYKGKFGQGFALLTPRRDTSQYVNINYYLA